MLLHLGLYSLFDLDSYANLRRRRGCITVSNSPNPSSVLVFTSGNADTGKKVFYCLNIAFLQKYCYFAVYKQIICKR